MSKKDQRIPGKPKKMRLIKDTLPETGPTTLRAAFERALSEGEDTEMAKIIDSYIQKEKRKLR